MKHGNKDALSAASLLCFLPRPSLALSLPLLHVTCRASGCGRWHVALIALGYSPRGRRPSHRHHSNLLPVYVIFASAVVCWPALLTGGGDHVTVARVPDLPTSMESNLPPLQRIFLRPKLQQAKIEETFASYFINAQDFHAH